MKTSRRQVVKYHKITWGTLSELSHFKVTDWFLKKLEKKGIEKGIIQALKKLGNTEFTSKKKFEKALPENLSKEHRTLSCQPED